jgi:hypothetical protein
MDIKKYIKVISIILVVAGLTGLVAYQFFLNQKSSNDEIIEKVSSDKNDMLIEQTLNQFAQYGKEKKYDDAMLMLSDDVNEELKNMKQEDFDAFFAQFAEYKKLTIQYSELGEYIPNCTKVQYGVIGEMIYEDGYKGGFEAIMTEDKEGLKIYGFHNTVREYIDEESFSGKESQVVQKLDEDTEKIKMMLNQFIQYSAEKKYEDAIALTSGSFEQYLRQLDESSKEIFFHEVASEFKEIKFGIQTDSSSKNQLVKYRIYGDFIYEKGAQKFDAIIVEDDAGFKIYEINVSELVTTSER